MRGPLPTSSLGCGKLFLQLREGSPNSANLISFFCQRASYKILVSITIITTVGKKNDLIVKQWPHPNNHGLIISKESCLFHFCQLANETNYIGTWLYSLVIIPWKQWGFEFTLYLTETTNTAVQTSGQAIDVVLGENLSQAISKWVCLFLSEMLIQVRKRKPVTRMFLL